jgi:hypothetical protein
MKNKQTKRDKEINKAFNVLKKHGLGFVIIDNKDFTEEWIFDLWSHYRIKPTKKNVERAKLITTDYLESECFEAMQDAIEKLAGNIRN